EVMASHVNGRLNLVFDADDTLWDSNVHFHEAFNEFAAAIESAGLSSSRDAIQDAVRRAELELIRIDGYGRRPYTLALHRAVRALAPVDLGKDLHASVRRIGRALVERECTLLPDVELTLSDLATRHQLLLFTKGQRDEQLLKLGRSGLAPLFSRVDTPREKDVASYRRLIDDARLAADSTFMIGNSPRSDINPAVRAGLRAVYIPHPQTWELEYEDIDHGDERIIHLTSFRRLLELF
ncbi:MAG: HAD family hydrolase, partial [Candidatus Binataceae bacterium]